MRKLVLSVLGASALAIASAASAQTIITPGAPAPPNVAGTTFTVSPTGSDGSIGATIGHVGIGVALAYLDFRFDDLQWREGHKRLTAWHGTFNARPAVVATPVVDDR